MPRDLSTVSKARGTVCSVGLPAWRVADGAEMEMEMEMAAGLLNNRNDTGSG